MVFDGWWCFVMFGFTIDIIGSTSTRRDFSCWTHVPSSRRICGLVNEDMILNNSIQVRPRFFFHARLTALKAWRSFSLSLSFDHLPPIYIRKA